ncbi:MAG: hypothetical protein R3C18_18180 [Planctomycetaceae bacterium]
MKFELRLTSIVMITCLVLLGCDKPDEPLPPTVSAPAPVDNPSPDVDVTPTPQEPVPPVVPVEEPAVVITASGFSIKASANWKDLSFSAKFSEPPFDAPKLYAWFDVTDSTAAECVLVGNLRVDSALAEERRLRMTLDDEPRIFSEWQVVKRYRSSKKDSVNFRIPFEYPGEFVTSITEIQGSFDVVTAEKVVEYTDVKFSDLPQMVETDEALKAGGVTLVITPNEFREEHTDYSLLCPTGAFLMDRESSFDERNYFIEGGTRLQERGVANDELNSKTCSFQLCVAPTVRAVPLSVQNLPVTAPKAMPEFEDKEAEFWVDNERNADLPKGLWASAFIQPKAGASDLATAIIRLEGPIARTLSGVTVQQAEATTAEGEVLQVATAYLTLGKRKSFDQSLHYSPNVSIADGNPAMVGVPYRRPEAASTKWAEFQGRLTVESVLEQKLVDLGQIPNDPSGEFTHPELTELGVKVEYQYEDADDPDKKRLRLKYELPNTSIWSTSIIRAANGDTLAGSISFTYGDNGEMIVDKDVKASDAQLKNAKLLVLLDTQTEEIEVPFRFTDLPVPAEYIKLR